MEGTKRAQDVYSSLNRIVYKSCRVALNMEGGTERAQPVHFCLNTIVCTSLVGCFGHGRD